MIPQTDCVYGCLIQRQVKLEVASQWDTQYKLVTCAREIDWYIPKLVSRKNQSSREAKCCPQSSLVVQPLSKKTHPMGLYSLYIFTRKVAKNRNAMMAEYVCITVHYFKVAPK